MRLCTRSSIGLVLCLAAVHDSTALSTTIHKLKQQTQNSTVVPSSELELLEPELPTVAHEGIATSLPRYSFGVADELRQASPFLREFSHEELTLATFEMTFGTSRRRRRRAPLEHYDPEPDDVKHRFNVYNGIEGRVQSAPFQFDDASQEQDSSERIHLFAVNAMLPSTFFIMASIILGSVLTSNQYTKFIPDSAATVAVSMILGLVLRQMIDYEMTSMKTIALVDATTLNLFLLPIIIFNSGWSLPSGNFMSQFNYVMIFALFGTVISTFVIGYSCMWIASHWNFPPLASFRASFCFASLISATDPVATIASYEHLSIPQRVPLLHTIVFGEAVINDAVAIILFNVINKGQGKSNVGILMHVAWLLFGSIGLGIAVTICLVLMMRFARARGDNVPQILFIFISPYFIYSLSEACELSGIIATLFSGIIFRLYGSSNMLPSAEAAASSFYDLTGRFADIGVFVICGTATALIRSFDGFVFGVVAICLCFIARAISVVSCAGMSNCLKVMYADTPHMITWKHQVMMWLGGLRGGIALVLSLEVDTTWCDVDTKSAIISATFMTICFLLLVCGCTTEFFLVKLGMVPSDGSMPSKGKETSLDEMHEDRYPMRVGRCIDGYLSMLLVGDKPCNKDEEVKQAH